MTIAVKLGELIQAQGVLQEIGNLPRIPQKTSYRLARVIRKTKDEVDEWNERHAKIIKDTGKCVPHPAAAGQFWLDPKSMTLEDNEKLKAAIKELNDIPVDVDAFPIKISEFGEDFDLKPNWLATLHWLIVEDEEPAKPAMKAAA